MSANSDEPRTEILFNGDRTSDIDEPREDFAGCDPMENGYDKRNGYWHCVKYQSREQSDVFTAVLAEVVRPTFDYRNSTGDVNYHIAEAASHVRTVLRLKAGGAM